MKILAADDELNALSVLVRSIKEVDPTSEIRSFEKTSDIIETMNNGYKPDVAFLDIEMHGLSGLELAKRLKEINPKTNIIFVTGFSSYAIEAMKLYPSGYIMKPASTEAIKKELENLRHPLIKESSRVKAQTFGIFDFFVEGKPIEFKCSKTKELLAYLIDRRGSSVNTAELCTILWENDDNYESHKSQIRKYISDLYYTFKDVGIEDIFIKRHNSFSIDISKIDCDYYRMLKYDVSAINEFNGEYMSQYSWAEMTLVKLENINTNN